VAATPLPASVAAEDVLEAYRWRWQVEIHFKRLKPVMDSGELPKKNPAASEARLNGKIMVALLIEAFIAKASLSPCDQNGHQSRHMA
jgi:IS4 transposase